MLTYAVLILTSTPTVERLTAEMVETYPLVVLTDLDALKKPIVTVPERYVAVPLRLNALYRMNSPACLRSLLREGSLGEPDEALTALSWLHALIYDRYLAVVCVDLCQDSNIDRRIEGRQGNARDLFLGNARERLAKQCPAALDTKKYTGQKR